ncbi:hypothetical protein EZS27_031716 [termite gut metagenome]|uniref:Uncharacterized protein n=1 Tax=termite gut metagenome TaxID=433724 RepID=A0A5J4QCD9_9ZZZZ
MEAKRSELLSKKAETADLNCFFEKSDLQALLSELQSFPLLQKLVEAGGIHLHIHSIVNNGYNYGCMIEGNNEGSLTNQHNERGNNIQGNDVSINPVS